MSINLALLSPALSLPRLLEAQSVIQSACVGTFHFIYFSVPFWDRISQYSPHWPQTQDSPALRPWQWDGRSLASFPAYMHFQNISDHNPLMGSWGSIEVPVQSSQSRPLTTARELICIVLSLAFLQCWPRQQMLFFLTFHTYRARHNGSGEWNHFSLSKARDREQLLALFSYFSKFGVKNFSFNRYPNWKSILGRESLLKTCTTSSS